MEMKQKLTVMFDTIDVFTSNEGTKMTFEYNGQEVFFIRNGFVLHKEDSFRVKGMQGTLQFELEDKNDSS